MRGIRLDFEKAEVLEKLLLDPTFMEEIAYLKPQTSGNNQIILYDPIQEHTFLDTEVVALTIFGRAIKRNFYQGEPNDIEFLVPYTTRQKDGIRIGSEILINKTNVQLHVPEALK